MQRLAALGFASVLLLAAVSPALAGDDLYPGDVPPADPRSGLPGGESPACDRTNVCNHGTVSAAAADPGRGYSPPGSGTSK